MNASIDEGTSKLNSSMNIEIKGDVAFFGPWVGEFGWELMTWQAWCRQQAKRFKKVYACSFPDMAYLYEDFATFVPHNYEKRYLDWTKVEQMEIKYEMPEDVTQQFIPFKEYRPDNQEFRRLGWSWMPGNFRKNDILIHARGINKGGKNYPVERWEKLVELLKEKIGDEGIIGSVGSEQDLLIKGTEDFRGLPLVELCLYLSQARMVIGQSSGVMHLASLCMAPHIVWADSRTYFGETLDKRYAQTWNPFKTPVHYIYDDEWNPDPQWVVQQFDEFSKQLQSLPPREYKEMPALPKIPDMLFKKLLEAVNSGKFFVSLSWKKPDDKLDHFWYSREFPNGDYQISLEHQAQDVKEHFARKEQQRKSVDESSVKKGMDGWE